MTELSVRPGVVDVISKAAGADEGTVDFIVDALLYEALCEEIDRLRPSLEADARAVLGHEAEQGLAALAKAYAVADDEQKAELAKRAEHLYSVVEVCKAEREYHGDDPDERDAATGRFAPKGFRGQVLNALQLFTGGGAGGGGKMRQESGRAMDQIAGGDKYSRARALGSALQSKTANSLTGGASGSVGRLTSVMGEIGPEAERVFGAGLTRLSYRYRGTERRVEPGLREATMGRLAAQEQSVNETSNGVTRTKREKLDDGTRLLIAGDVSARYLSSKVADLELAKLSLAAGQLPPSRGVLIDSDGVPVSESVGVNGDHYLPFDLKNLKRLKGGQYVRTRTTGGLTDEDIYTGLLSGARQVQVVSNSGVFTVEFDPSLRGGRRYSDKARAMVKRYSAILETVGSEKLVAQDLPPREQARIRQEAFQRANGNQALAESFATADLAKARFEAKFKMKDDDELWDEAGEIATSELTSQLRGQGNKAADSSRVLGQRQKEIFGSLKEEERANAVRTYKLDAEGYKAAQKALAQEFPFFIRDVRFEHLGDFRSARGIPLAAGQKPASRGGRDIGYTPRGGLAPGQRAASAAPQADKAPAKDAAAPVAGQETAAVAAPAAAAPAARDTVKRAMSSALSIPLQAWANIPPAGGYDEPILTDKPEEAKGYKGEQYLKWLFDGYAEGEPGKVAEFLMNPDTPEVHRKNTIAGLKVLKAGAANLYEAEDFDQAIELVKASAQIGKPFAAPGADPTEGPQLMPEIGALHGDVPKLLAYAEANPEVAAMAQGILDQGEEEHAAKLSKDHDKVRRLLAWPAVNGIPDPSRPIANAEPDDEALAGDLMAAQAAGQPHPMQADLDLRHKAYALARSLRISALLNGEAVPKLPFGKALAPRAPRVPVVKVHGPNSPAARALAARRRR